MVIENKLRTAISVILACLRFTAIQIGIALMAISAKSSNVLIGGRPMAENSPSITPTGTFGESCRLSGQNPGAAISIERCSARKTVFWETSTGSEGKESQVAEIADFAGFFKKLSKGVI